MNLQQLHRLNIKVFHICLIFRNCQNPRNFNKKQKIYSRHGKFVAQFRDDSPYKTYCAPRDELQARNKVKIKYNVFREGGYFNMKKNIMLLEKVILV